MGWNDFLNGVGNWAAGMASTAGGGIMGQIFGQQNDKRQLTMNQQLLDQQIEANKKMSEYGMGLQKEMWDYTNFENQKKHLEAAGLNSALLYAKGGAGGQLGQGVQAVSNQSAPHGGGENVAMAGMGLQVQQQAAAVELMRAQAAKARADAEKTSGADTQLTIAQTGNVKVDTTIKEAQSKIANATTEEQINIIGTTMQKLSIEMGKENIEKYVLENTANTQIQTAQQNLISMVLEQQAKKQGITESKARISQMAANIQQGWKALEINDRKVIYDYIINSKNAESNKENAETNKGRLLWDKFINDMPESDKALLRIGTDILKTTVMMIP